MAYATVSDVQNRMIRTMGASEQTICTNLLDDAAVIIDAAASSATAAQKKVVSCRMVMRALGDGSSGTVPMGASQGSMSGLGYAESWTMGAGGSVGELYLSKGDRQLLGLSNAVGSYSPVQELVPEVAT